MIKQEITDTINKRLQCEVYQQIEDRIFCPLLNTLRETVSPEVRIQIDTLMRGGVNKSVWVPVGQQITMQVEYPQ